MATFIIILYYHPGKASNNFAFTPESRVVASCLTTVTPRLRGLSYSDSDNPDHKIEVSLNGNLLGDVEFDGQTLVEEDFSTVTTLNSGSNTVNINIPGGLVSGYESYVLYSITVEYCRELAVVDGYLEFELESSGSVEVKDLVTNSGTVYRFDDNDELVELQNVDYDLQGDSTYWAKFSGPAGKYYVIEDGSYLELDEIEVNTASSLIDITNGYEMVAIAGHGLESGTEAYVDYRSSADSISAVSVNLQDVFDEFSYGKK